MFDADIYGPSLPTRVQPDPAVLQMNPETKAITPPEFEGVKVVSFGFAGQGSATMRGPMVSGETNKPIIGFDTCPAGLPAPLLLDIYIVEQPPCMHWWHRVSACKIMSFMV